MFSMSSVSRYFFPLPCVERCIHWVLPCMSCELASWYNQDKCRRAAWKDAHLRYLNTTNEEKNGIWLGLHGQKPDNNMTSLTNCFIFVLPWDALCCSFIAIGTRNEMNLESSSGLVEQSTTKFIFKFIFRTTFRNILESKTETSNVNRKKQAFSVAKDTKRKRKTDSTKVNAFRGYFTNCQSCHRMQNAFQRPQNNSSKIIKKLNAIHTENRRHRNEIISSIFLNFEIARPLLGENKFFKLWPHSDYCVETPLGNYMDSTKQVSFVQWGCRFIFPLKFPTTFLTWIGFVVSTRNHRWVNNMWFKLNIFMKTIVDCVQPFHFQI